MVDQQIAQTYQHILTQQLNGNDVAQHESVRALRAQLSEKMAVRDICQLHHESLMQWIERNKGKETESLSSMSAALPLLLALLNEIDDADESTTQTEKENNEDGSEFSPVDIASIAKVLPLIRKVSHDLNNVFAIVKGYGELLAMKHASIEKDDKNLKQIFGAITRGGEIIDQLHCLSQTDKPEQHEIEMGHCIKTLLSILQSSVPSNITLLPIVPDDDVHIRGCLEFLELLITILIRHIINTVGGYETQIKVGLSMQSSNDTASRVVISLSDGGVQLTEEVLQDAFDTLLCPVQPIYTNLGPIVARQLLKRMSGDATVETVEGLGPGLLIELPIQ